MTYSLVINDQTDSGALRKVPFGYGTVNTQNMCIFISHNKVLWLFKKARIYFSSLLILLLFIILFVYFSILKKNRKCIFISN